MQNVQFLCSSRKWQVLLGMPDIELVNILTASCNLISTEKEDKDTNCCTNKPYAHNTGSEQCCTNAEPERSCIKMNSNPNCYEKKPVIQI